MHTITKFQLIKFFFLLKAEVIVHFFYMVTILVKPIIVFEVSRYGKANKDDTKGTHANTALFAKES